MPDAGYPDDIRRYDNHPSSPFYAAPRWSPGDEGDSPHADAFRERADRVEIVAHAIGYCWDQVSNDQGEDDVDALSDLADDLEAVMAKHAKLIGARARGEAGHVAPYVRAMLARLAGVGA